MRIVAVSDRRDSPIGMWNRRAGPRSQVQTDAWIVSVNNVSGDYQAIPSALDSATGETTLCIAEVVVLHRR